MSLSGFLYAIAAAVTWGLVYTIDQRVLKGLTPLTLLFIDSVLTAILLLPVAFLQKSTLSTLSHTPFKLWGLVILSLALAALANFFIYSSIRIMGASTASIFEIVYPFFVALFTALVFGSELNVFFFLGAVLIFLGSAIIIGLA
ncbi:MAG: DMT family transporter [Candidatus Kaiserbacteria bacterium]|nr:DMT family transporter [Candidatus Kaiserbacteria bacterium]